MNVRNNYGSNNQWRCCAYQQNSDFRAQIANFGRISQCTTAEVHSPSGGLKLQPLFAAILQGTGGTVTVGVAVSGVCQLDQRRNTRTGRMRNKTRISSIESRLAPATTHYPPAWRVNLRGCASISARRRFGKPACSQTTGTRYGSRIIIIIIITGLWCADIQ